MKFWLHILFYIICFFIVVTAIYRLGMATPPTPGEDGYLWYCLAVGSGALLIGASVVVAPIFYEIYRHRKTKGKV